MAGFMKDAVTPPATERARLDYPSAEIWLHVTTEVERKYRLSACRKEPWTVEWLDAYVQPGEVLYDIGANVGGFTLIAAVGRGAHAIAFEPSYANYGRLCENLHLNGCDATVIPFPLPLSDANGMTSLLYRTMDVGQSRHSLKARWRFGKERKDEDGRYQQPVCAITLDTARTLFGWSAPAHIKLDVDGAEVRVLTGAAETLRLPDLRSLMVEVDRDLWDDVLRLVTAAGLRITRQVDRGDAPLYALFERPGHPAASA